MLVGAIYLVLLLCSICTATADAVPSTAALNWQLSQPVSSDSTPHSRANPDSHVELERITSASTLQQHQLQARAGDVYAAALSSAASTAGHKGHIRTPATDAKPSVKPLWPLDGIDLALLAIILFSLSLAGGAGIGGGAILVPVYLMLRGWPTAIAVALSNVTILGGSLANFICNVRRHRPNGKRAIDWELILMMEPTTIAGALVGAVANKLLPNWCITYLLAILLTLMALRLYSKGKQTYAKETQLLLAAKAAAKERRRCLSPACDIRPTATAPEPTGASNTSVGTGLGAVPRSNGPARSSASHSNTLSRSFSRLRGSLVVGVGFEQGTSITSPGSALITPSGRSLISPAAQYQLQASEAGTAEELVDDGRGPGTVDGPDQQLPGQAIEQYMRSTLFQGDVADGCEAAVVALPASDDLSPASSDTLDDVEEGRLEAGQTSYSELLQPLLLVDSASADDLQHMQDQHSRCGASPLADVAGNKAWGVRAAQQSPDLTIHLGAIQEAAPKAPALEPSLPLPHFLTLLGLSAWVVAADIAQDSFRCGSWQYWASQLSVLIPVVSILAVCRQMLLRKYNHDDLPAGWQLPEGELHWTRRTTILYPLLCSSAGLIAGLFGIGGGVVKGPLMLELGVPADVAAATSATMIMFTAGSACLVYSRFGQILFDYAVVLAVLGFTITLCSQLLTFLLVKLLGRRSVIVFMMVALMGAATGIMYIQTGLVTADLVRHPEDLWKFGSICPADRQPNLVVQLGRAVMARLQQ